MRVSLVVLISLVLASAPARAEQQVGIVVTGDVALAPKVTAHVERWLTSHGHKVVPAGLSPDAKNTLVNCFVVDDPKCARGVVEAGAEADTLVYTRVDVAAKDVTFTAYWFVKGHEAVGERRVCEQCKGTAWHALLDAMLATLAGSSHVETGRLDLRSKPPGMTVMLDHAQIGVTPLERDLPVGPHTITLQHDGKTVGEKEIRIESGATNHVNMHVQGEERRPVMESTHGSRVLPALMLAAGIGALGGGAILVYYGERSGPNVKYVYPDATAPGIGLAALGLGASIAGGVLLYQASQVNSVPVVAVGSHSGYIGWLTRF